MTINIEQMASDLAKLPPDQMAELLGKAIPAVRRSTHWRGGRDIVSSALEQAKRRVDGLARAGRWRVQECG